MISETLTNDTLDRFGGARLVINAKRHALVIPEIELGKIALQMQRTHVMISSDDARA
jgi:hypothetical protein